MVIKPKIYIVVLNGIVTFILNGVFNPINSLGKDNLPIVYCNEKKIEVIATIPSEQPKLEIKNKNSNCEAFRYVFNLNGTAIIQKVSS